MLTLKSKSSTELQIRKGNRDNSEIAFHLVSKKMYIMTPTKEPFYCEGSQHVFIERSGKLSLSYPCCPYQALHTYSKTCGGVGWLVKKFWVRVFGY